MAPSSKRSNCWQFIVVDDKDTLEKLSFCKESGAAFVKDAALAIVVTADSLASDVWIEDASIASIMIQLQAEDLGLGSCWVQVRERFTANGTPANEYIHELLDLPLQLQVLSVIAIGHKGMERKPFDDSHLQWEKVHINKFGGNNGSSIGQTQRYLSGYSRFSCSDRAALPDRQMGRIRSPQTAVGDAKRYDVAVCSHYFLWFKSDKSVGLILLGIG